MFLDGLPAEEWTPLSACFLQASTLGRPQTTAPHPPGRTHPLGIWLQCHSKAVSWGAA